MTSVADRVAVCCAWDTDLPDALVVIDLERTAPARDDPVRRGGLAPRVVRDVWLHVDHPTRFSTSARDLTSTDVRWTAPGTPLHADAQSAFLLTVAGRSMQIASVDVTTGCTA